jgi:electron transport complex protein RnfC
MGLFRLKGFPGNGNFRHGIHPPDNKHLSNESKVEVMDIPKIITLPLLQHLGVPCKQLVKSGQMVKYGEIIGEGEAFISASLHSPVAGKVKKKYHGHPAQRNASFCHFHPDRRRAGFL